jgi:NAD-dependent SIR2 family protein deacetylase
VSSVIDNYVLPVICPKCGAHIQKPIAWFRENHEVTCPCGTTIYLATEELIAIIDQLEVAIGRLNVHGSDQNGMPDGRR